MFNENAEEYSAKQGKMIPVWFSPKYEESKRKAIEIIENGKYDLSEADFWILMNETKSGKMAYTGLIISHNGCLKINDGMDTKFKPECVCVKSMDGATALCSPTTVPNRGFMKWVRSAQRTARLTTRMLWHSSVCSTGWF